MADSENNIPTLIDIAHEGNIDMLNHFDAHQFDAEEDTIKPISSLENASELENNNIEDSSVYEASEINEIPSITIEKNASPLEADEASESILPFVENAIEEKLEANNAGNDSPINNLPPEDLKMMIDHAINDALPGIKTHLQDQLYSKFDI